MTTKTGVRTEIIGADRCAATLNVAAYRLARLDSAPRQASVTVASETRRRAPRRTGRLAASVAPSPQGNAARVIVAARYAWPVHSGVRAPLPGHQPGRPFAANAADATEAVWVGQYADNVNRVMGTVKGA